MLARISAFIHSGAPLLLAAIAAMILANSPARDWFAGVLATPMGVSAGAASFVLPLHGWIDDALMAAFFLLVGLDIRRELTEGQLATPRRAAAPALAAAGGMVVPALIYVALARGDAAALRGWAVPVATDIAFSLAALRALGARMPAGLAVFLAALAILDDLGAIAIIAVVYTAQLGVVSLLAAGAVWLGLLTLNRSGVRLLAPYVIGFVLIWACLARAGVHPTLAGVAVAFVVPQREQDGHSPARALERFLSGWIAGFVLPLFGLANAGLPLDSLSRSMLTGPVLPGVLLGLLVGKPLGVFGATWLGARLRVIHLPAQLSWRLLAGAALLCGIGFTMSLFIGHLAFSDATSQVQMRAGVFAASLLSAALGLAVLRWAGRRAV